MKPMLAPAFRKKVHMIPEARLNEFLQPGFERFLPDEFQQGQVSLDSLARDFVSYRQYIETKTKCRVPSDENKALLTAHKNEKSSIRQDCLQLTHRCFHEETDSTESCIE